MIFSLLGHIFNLNCFCYYLGTDADSFVYRQKYKFTPSKSNLSYLVPSSLFPVPIIFCSKFLVPCSMFLQYLFLIPCSLLTVPILSCSNFLGPCSLFPVPLVFCFKFLVPCSLFLKYILPNSLFLFPCSYNILFQVPCSLFI